MGMKAAFIALLALSLCLPALGAKKESGYKGRVKSVKISEFKIEEKFGKPVRTQDGVSRFSKYDEKGNQTELVVYDASGKISYKWTYTYDRSGNKTSEMKSEPKTAFGEIRFVPIKETTWEFTYWD